MASINDPIITTTHGQVRGKQRQTLYDDLYYCFDGIPYAKPPLGELRFKSPQDLPPWAGVRDCTEVAPKAVQWNKYKQEIEGSEDCLYLNIYVKKLQTDKPLPVMVYIYGGGFNTGDASRLSWGPEYFMMQDVVLITIAYRLGPLGFLSLADPALKVPGNAGLKDQIMALKWIKRNCFNFNGDPENITLFGHSAGGRATHYLMLTEQCKGLFHKAILMAGFGLSYEQIPNLPYRLAKHLGYADDDDDERKVLEFLNKVEARKLTNFNIWTQEEKDQGFNYIFMVRKEPYESEDAIFTREPIEILRNSWSNDIPIILGGTSMEGLPTYQKWMCADIYEKLQQHPEYLLPINLQHACDLPLQRKLGKKMQAIHFGAEELSVAQAYCGIEFNSFDLCNHRAHRTIKSRRAHASAPTYLYRFDFDSPTFNLYRIKVCGPDLRGAGHVDELSYIFYMPQSFKLERESAEFKTIVRMVSMWTAFAASSDPNTSAISPAVWLPVAREGPYKCLNISHEVNCIDYPEQQKCELWDLLYKEAGVPLI